MESLLCKICFELAFSKDTPEIILCKCCHYLYCQHCYDMIKKCSNCKSDEIIVLNTNRTELKELLHIDECPYLFLNFFSKFLKNNEIDLSAKINQYLEENNLEKPVPLDSYDSYIDEYLHRLFLPLVDQINFFETDFKTRQKKLDEFEEKLKEQERNLDHRDTNLKDFEEKLDDRENSLDKREKELNERLDKLKKSETEFKESLELFTAEKENLATTIEDFEIRKEVLDQLYDQCNSEMQCIEEMKEEKRFFELEKDKFNNQLAELDKTKKEIQEKEILIQNLHNYCSKEQERESLHKLVKDLVGLVHQYDCKLDKFVDVCFS